MRTIVREARQPRRELRRPPPTHRHELVRPVARLSRALWLHTPRVLLERRPLGLSRRRSPTRRSPRRRPPPAPLRLRSRHQQQRDPPHRLQRHRPARHERCSGRERRSGRRVRRQPARRAGGRAVAAPEAAEGRGGPAGRPRRVDGQAPCLPDRPARGESLRPSLDPLPLRRRSVLSMRA